MGFPPVRKQDAAVLPGEHWELLNSSDSACIVNTFQSSTTSINEKVAEVIRTMHFIFIDKPNGGGGVKKERYFTHE